MLIRTFKKGFHWLAFLLVPLGILMWVDRFFAYQSLTIGRESDAPLYLLLVNGLDTIPILQVIFGFGMVFLQALLVNGICQTNNLTGKQTWLPGFFYLVLMSSDPALLSFHPVIPANLFLILALSRLMVILDQKEHVIDLFNLGALVSIAGLFYYPALLFLAWLLIVVGQYLLASFRSVVASVMGFLAPIFFLGTFWFLTDRLAYEVGTIFGHFDLFLIFEGPLFPYTRMFIILLGLLTILSIIRLRVVYLSDKPVRIRKRFGILLYFFIFSLLSFLLSRDYFDVHHAFLMIPLSVILSVFFLEMKKKWLAELLFYALLASIILGKFGLTGI
ncbi:MAG TPA: DUF6427 family protein [Bacteroidales bacterium]|nr:DUF6427 family protein [Bacteroidales bacterium]